MRKDEINKLKKADFKRGFTFLAMNDLVGNASFDAGLYTLQVPGYFQNSWKGKIHRSKISDIKTQLLELV